MNIFHSSWNSVFLENTICKLYISVFKEMSPSPRGQGCNIIAIFPTSACLHGTLARCHKSVSVCGTTSKIPSCDWSRQISLRPGWRQVVYNCTVCSAPYQKQICMPKQHSAHKRGSCLQLHLYQNLIIS